jgi:hypothetical protein
MALNVFLSGLEEPLGSTVRSMLPSTLAIPFSYCIKEQNISYARPTPRIPQPIVIRNQPHSRPQPYNQTRFQNFNKYRNQNHYNPNYRRPFQNSRPNNFSNNQRQSSFFNNQNNSKYSRPEPMDVSTGDTIQRPINIHKNNNPFRHHGQNFNKNNASLYNISANQSPTHQCSCAHIEHNNSNNGRVHNNNNFRNLDSYYNLDHGIPA